MTRRRRRHNFVVISDLGHDHILSVANIYFWINVFLVRHENKIHPSNSLLATRNQVKWKCCPFKPLDRLDGIAFP
jgi:hypothetical protein